MKNKGLWADLGLVLVALIYFLVADRDEGDDKISDTLLIIGALLLFGL